MESGETTSGKVPRSEGIGVWIGLGALVVVLVGFGVYLVTRGSSSPSDNGKVQVVAAENFWGNIAAQIGGSHVQVTSIITDPNADPHLYESDAHDAAAVASAKVVVENGVGYDDFFDKLLGASPSSSRKVVSAQNVLNVTGSDANPHLWYDTPRVPEVAAAIEGQLATVDPKDASAYQQNLKTFDSSLQPILSTVAEIKQKYPNAPVAYTERVPGYLLANAGLDVKTPVGFASAIEDGNEPSPADTEAMDNLMTSHGIKVLLYNAQTTSAVTEHVKELARQAGIPVVGVTETLPANEPTFQAWQLDQARALLVALGS
jgi:zinc/manganese transport system substrate-binding protein